MSGRQDILFLSGSLPHMMHGGGGITAFSILNSLRAEGAFLTVIGFRGKFETPYDAQAENDLMDMGIPVKWIDEVPFEKLPINYRKLVYVNGCQYAPALQKIVDEKQPGAVVCYHWESLAAVFPLRKTFFQAGFIGDPLHLPFMYKLKLLHKYEPNSKQGLRYRINRFLQVRRMIIEQRMMLLKSDCCGAFAAHHAAWFRANGVPACQYVRTPVPDPSVKGQITAASCAPKERPVFLLLGHLAGTSTLMGIDLFFSTTILSLEREFGEDGFEVLVVGGMKDKVPSRLLERMNHPAVRMMGQINPPDRPFAESHFLVVPTPIELGIRVRILTGFSYGACVVAHRANQAGIPELQDNVNCVLCDTGRQLGERLVKLWYDSPRRRDIAIKGRETFEQFFTPERTGREIVQLVTRQM